MLKIYHVPGTRAYRVIWLCEELAVPYELVRVDFSAEYRASPEWRRLNPVGKVPVMTDGDLTMFESGAMVQYVLDRYGDGRLQPEPGTPEHALYLQWSWFAEATFARPIGELVNHRRAFPGAEKADVMDEMKSRAKLCAGALDSAIADRTWLLGDDFTAADVMMAYTLMIYLGRVDDAFPDNVAAYWDRLKARPAYRATETANRMD